MDRRDFVVGSAAGLAAVGGLGTAASADDYPSRAVTIINPFPPGGAADVVVRPFASALEPVFKRPVVVETKAGAAGAIGAQVAAAAKPDGYTLMVHIVSLSGFAEVDRIYGRPVKFTMNDFVPIARFIADPMVLLTNEATGYKSLADLVGDAKRRPGQLIFSSSGMHGAAHLPAGIFTRAAGIQMKHLPTSGGGPAMTALLGNNAQMTVVSFAGASSQIKAGKVRALACFGDKRNPRFPDVPTLKELGYDAEFYLWVGLFAPKGTPDAIVAKLRAQVGTAAAAPAFQQAMSNLNQDIAYLDAPDFKSFLAKDLQRVEGAVRGIGKI